MYVTVNALSVEAALVCYIVDVGWPRRSTNLSVRSNVIVAVLAAARDLPAPYVIPAADAYKAPAPRWQLISHTHPSHYGHEY